MSSSKPTQRGTRLATAVAILFGLLTIFSGGSVLFGGDRTAQMAGDVVRFVLWFNFLAGFGYVLAGVGLVLRQRWSYLVALALVAGTLIVVAAFTRHALQGGAYEVRTFLALTFRLLILGWIAWTARIVS